MIAGDDRPRAGQPKKIGQIDDFRLTDTLEENL
jgi:hypothetical protein